MAGGREPEAEVIRPFDMRDLPQFARVKDRGLCLASQLAFTRGPQALQAVLVDACSGARDPASTQGLLAGALAVLILLYASAGSERCCRV